MRLLSASLGPLMCRTLDHLLCPAGTSAVRCSVRPPAALQHGGSGWKARAEHGRATRTPGPRGHKHWAATLLKLITAPAYCFFLVFMASPSDQRSLPASLLCTDPGLRAACSPSHTFLSQIYTQPVSQDLEAVHMIKPKAQWGHSRIKGPVGGGQREFRQLSDGGANKATLSFCVCF